MLKNILILLIITIPMIGCATVQPAPKSVSLKDKLRIINPAGFERITEIYNLSKQKTITQCSNDSTFFQEIARKREAGFSSSYVIEDLFDIMQRDIDNGVELPIKVVLYQTTLATVIYNSEMTPQEVFNDHFKYCTERLVEYLDKWYRNQQIWLLKQSHMKN